MQVGGLKTEKLQIAKTFIGEFIFVCQSKGPISHVVPVLNWLPNRFERSCHNAVNGLLFCGQYFEGSWFLRLIFFSPNYRVNRVIQCLWTETNFSWGALEEFFLPLNCSDKLLDVNVLYRHYPFARGTMFKLRQIARFGKLWFKIRTSIFILIQNVSIFRVILGWCIVQ